MRATPDFDFALGETADMIRDTTARFADEQIAPLAAKADAGEAEGGDADSHFTNTLQGARRRADAYARDSAPAKQGSGAAMHAA